MQEQRSTPDPGAGPLNPLFVSDSACPGVLQWGHSVRVTCHAGLSQIMHFLRQRFWSNMTLSPAFR